MKPPGETLSNSYLLVSISFKAIEMSPEGFILGFMRSALLSFRNTIPQSRRDGEKSRYLRRVAWILPANQSNSKGGDDLRLRKTPKRFSVLIRLPLHDR